MPFDPQVFQHNSSFGHLLPWEFSGWKKETDAWKKSCYLHAGLNPAMPVRLSGPGALQLLKDACINSFEKFSVGCSKHAVMCNKLGNVMADGIVMRLQEEVFMTFYLSPYLEYVVASGRYDVRAEDLSGQTFLFQVAGPRSLEVLEAATGESLRDIDFLWHRPSHIQVRGDRPGPRPVRVFRLGVARTLAYEVHGDIGDVLAVYEAILAAGGPFGIERLGLQAYGMNHTEGGFAQSFIHFLPAWPQDPEFFNTVPPQYRALFTQLKGSAGPDANKRFANPVELGWAHMMKFDHAFT
ncbi:MAG: aminomethyl transferase family protein, partial [Alcaligenaceae bacterium]